jgi:hypothetical protein
VALAPAGVFDPNSPQVSDTLRDVYTHFKESVDEETALSTNLADYVFLPLSYLLKHPNLGDTQTTYLLKIISLIVSHCWSSASALPYVLAKQLFPLVTFLAGGSPDTKDKSEINNRSDELKSAGAETLNSFFRSLAIQKEAKIYDFFSNVETLPALGHSVRVLLDFLVSGKSIQSQLQALHTLDTLYFRLINDGEILSYILPGNISTLTKVIASPGSKVHYSVLVKALDLMEKLLVLVYSDEELQVNYKEVESIEELFEDTDLNQISLTEDRFRKLHRTNAWLKGTSAQMKLALQNVKKVHTHDKLEVRLALEGLAESIIQKCLLSLNSSIPIAVEILAYLSSGVPRLHLTEPKNPQNKELLQNIVASELDKYVDSLGSVIQSPNDDKIISTICAIKFTAKENPNSIVTSKLINMCISELSDSLRKVQVKSKIVPTTSEISELMFIAKDASNININSKSLTVFDSVLTCDVQLQLASLFQTLGELHNPSEMINDILANDQLSLNERSVGLWITNNLMKGYFTNIEPQIVTNEFLIFDDQDHDELMLVQRPEFIYSVLDYSKGILDETSEMEPSLDVVQANSIALDTIGVIQHHLKEDFREELIDYLYPVIESLASPSEVVRQHGLITSKIIADHLYSGSLYQMILNNSDYIVDAVSIRLSNAMTTRTTAILAVCTKISGFKIIETFKDVMEILFSLLDYYHGYEDMCIGFFVLFEIIADEIKKKYLSDYGFKKLESHESSSTYAPWSMTSINQLISLLDKTQRDIAHLKEREPSGDFEGEIGNKDSDDEDEEPKIPEVKKEWTSPVPEDAYKLLQQITHYGERLSTHPSTKLRIQILRTFNKVIPLLATAPDNLLPIVASIWPTTSSMVNSSDPKVVIPASEVISKIVEYAGSFMASRFLNLWSTLKNNQLLVTAEKQAMDTKKVVLPGINQKCYNSLVDMLVKSLNRLGRYVPDIITEKIVRSCIGVVPPERFERHSDMAWFIKNQIYGVANLKVPDDITIKGEVYRFAQVS